MKTWLWPSCIFSFHVTTVFTFWPEHPKNLLYIRIGSHFGKVLQIVFTLRLKRVFEGHLIWRTDWKSELSIPLSISSPRWISFTFGKIKKHWGTNMQLTLTLGYSCLLCVVVTLSIRVFLFKVWYTDVMWSYLWAFHKYMAKSHCR